VEPILGFATWLGLTGAAKTASELHAPELTTSTPASYLTQKLNSVSLLITITNLGYGTTAKSVWLLRKCTFAFYVSSL
jgi:hypothetical protein